MATTATTTIARPAMEKPSQEQIQQQPLRCPRCDSTNTKFCYYNNYSLSQPRHFCKACKRYWTRGGTLRNVPVGGGCRKIKRAKGPSSSSSYNSSSATYTTSSTVDSAATAINNPTSTTSGINNPLGAQLNNNPSSCGGARSLNPLLYGLPANLVPYPPPCEVISNFPFSSNYYDSNHHINTNSLASGLGLGFLSGRDAGHRNGFATSKQIIQDLISPSYPYSVLSTFGSNSCASTTSTTTTTSATNNCNLQPISFSLASSVQQQQNFNFRTLFPYEDLQQMKEINQCGGVFQYAKDDDRHDDHHAGLDERVKMEDDSDYHGQYGNMINDPHHEPMATSSDPSIVWNNSSAGATGQLGANWLGPNYSSMGSSSSVVPSFI